MNLLTCIVIGRLASSLACALIAGYLAMRSLDGWGWFLFVALWLGSVSGSSSGKKTEAA